MGEITKANKITVHFECCECGARQTIFLNSLRNTAFLCNKCNKVENYMEVIGVTAVGEWSNELLVKENKELRKLLWLRHGCEIASLYGDDGELQCGKCMIDFRRDSAESINEKWFKQGKEAVQAQWQILKQFLSGDRAKGDNE